MIQAPTMGFVDDVISGLNRARDERFDGVNRRFAIAAEYDPTNLGRILKGEKTSWLESFGRLVDAAGLKVVATPSPGESSTLLSLRESPAQYGGEVIEYSPASNYVFIEKALARPAAGGGSLETSGETEGGLMFRLDWISNKTRSSHHRLRIMEVEGVSMSPTIEHGDVVLVDEGNHELAADRVFVIRKGDGIHVKRFRQLPGGGMLFMGDNRSRDFEDVRVEPGDGDDFAVIGRVLWAGKEL